MRSGAAGSRVASPARSGWPGSPTPAFPRPEVTFLLAVDPTEAYRRIERRGTDHESLEFLARSAEAYRRLPEVAQFVVVDAGGTLDEVAEAIRGGVAAPCLRPGRRPGSRRR